jgi:hypothetical protein
MSPRKPLGLIGVGSLLPTAWPYAGAASLFTLNASGLFKESDFTGDDDVDLSTYDSEWEQHDGTTPSTGGWEIKSNKCSKVDEDDNFYASVQRIGAAGLSDERLQCTNGASQASAIFGHMLRYKVDDGGNYTFYLGNVDGNGNSYSLWRVDNGAWSKKGETFEAVAPESADIAVIFSLTHIADNNALLVRADDADKLTWTDIAANSPLRSGYDRAGFRGNMGSNVDNYDLFYWSGRYVAIDGLPNGWDVVVTDRDGSTASATESSGAVSIDTNILYAPFQKYEIRNGADEVQLTITAEDAGVTSLVGGDDITYTG